MLCRCLLSDLVALAPSQPHALFTIVKENDGRFRFCNNLDLIGHSAFVIETYTRHIFIPGRPVGLAGVVTNAECSIKSGLLQILERPSISFTTVKTICDQCKYSLRDENNDFDDSNQIWPARKNVWKLMKPWANLIKGKLGDHWEWFLLQNSSQQEVSSLKLLENIFLSRVARSGRRNLFF